MTVTFAPAFDCVICSRRIAKTAEHHLLGYPDGSADRLLCGRCMLSTKHLHARFYPECDKGWRDLHDHPACSASRAAAAHLLGMRPR